MKIWKKLVLFTIAIISIVLSCSRYYIVRNNFLNAIENTSKQNTNQHTLEKYILESNIVKIIQDGEEVTDEKIVEYLNSLNTYIKDSELISLYTEDYNKIYSNIEDIDSIDISAVLKENKEIYVIKKIQNKYYMLFSSDLNINNKTIYIVNRKMKLEN